MGEILFHILLAFIVYLIASRGLQRRLRLLESVVNLLQSELTDVRTKAEAAAAAAARSQASAPAAIEKAAEAPPPPITAPAAPPLAPPATPQETAPRQPEPAMAAAAATVSTASTPSPARPAPTPVPAPRPRPVEPVPVQIEAPAWLNAVKTWLFTGNLVAKMGLLILFIGVSFLLKYASERVTVPIELRLAGIVLADIGLLIWGWRMRLTHRGLSLPIQGAALGIMMMVVFAAFKMYHLMPSSLAFALLFVLTVFTCLLAVLQNAFWLAAFGIAFGFMAPIMTSSGSGNHVALFSYYALLNAGILAIALKRSWRALNLIGFAFTFLIGTAWGVQRYSADTHYLSSQLFLALFFVFYVAIALIWAMRQSLQLKAYVDATLVFGTPLAAFGLQLGLMRNVEFGNAFSALAFGVFYTVLALAMWSRRGTKLKLLIESFLALGVVFGTLAIPFALDGRWTSAAWALEGAAVVWVGLRQRQRLTWMFGLLVQAGAWISFVGAISGLAPQLARESNLWLGFLILAASAFFMATVLRSHQEDDGEAQAFPAAATFFLGVAALWFMGGAWTEILLRQTGVPRANMLVGSGLATAALLALIAARMKWVRAGTFALVAQMVAGAALLMLVVFEWSWQTPSAGLFDNALLGALMIFGAAIFTSFQMWRARENLTLAAISQLMLVWSAFWWFGPILNAVSGTLMLALAPAAAGLVQDQSWWSMYIVCVAVSAAVFAMLARRLDWFSLRLLSASTWLMLPLSTLVMLGILYGDQQLPIGLVWTGYLATWAASEFLLRYWRNSEWAMPGFMLKLIHVLRTAGPWIMLWKVGEIVISEWLFGAAQERQLLGEGGSMVSGSWANFVPAWAMMAAVIWLIGRSKGEHWPSAPLGAWYRHVLIPVATAWSLLLALVWNLQQDGSMAPLPYIPVLNPLDLTTAFALALGAFCQRMLKADGEQLSQAARALVARMPLCAMIGAYVWFNLILLRTASQVLDIDYNAGALFASQYIQAMLSLVWSITALVIMWRATAKGSRRRWMLGAGFLALVVAKLFLVDLAGVGTVSRIVSFVGVGLLMVLIGYLAPYPSESERESETAHNANNNAGA